MDTKLFRAFGYLVIRNSIAAGENINDDTLKNNTYTFDSNFRTVWLQTEGLSTHTNQSGAVQERVAGDSTISKPLLAGKNTIVFNTNTSVFCISPEANKSMDPVIPNLAHFSLSAGSSATLPVGTKLFLVHGELSVGEMILSGIRQLEIKSRETSVQATTDCFGLLFL
jgi:hypothetical protein